MMYLPCDLLHILYLLVTDAESQWHECTDNLDYMATFNVPTGEDEATEARRDREAAF